MLKKELQISDELTDIVTALTATINIISISVTSGVSTIVTNSITIYNNSSKIMKLQSGMIVTMGLKNYQVSNIIDTPAIKSFDITGIGITATDWNVSANFQTGTRTEINEILTQERTDNNRFKRFPLIWYIYNDERDNGTETIDFESTVNLAFAYKSNNTDKTTKRLDENVSPIIQPLLSLFLLWIQSTDFYYMFELGGFEKPLDEKINIFTFYGSSDKKKNVLETSSDAIELMIDLKFKKQY